MDGHLTFDTVSPGSALMIIYYGIVLGGFSEMALVWYARRSTRKIAAATVLIVLIGFAAGAFAVEMVFILCLLSKVRHIRKILRGFLACDDYSDGRL